MEFDIDEAIAQAEALAIIGWQHVAPQEIIRNIKNTISIGNSPVEGNGRFVKYSEGYKKAIKDGRYRRISPGKTITPVNLYLSGKMIKSLKSAKTQSGFSIYFDHYLAEIHNEKGAGKSKVIRRIMPLGDEVYKKSITQSSDQLLERLLLKELSNLA